MNALKLIPFLLLLILYSCQSDDKNRRQQLKTETPPPSKKTETVKTLDMPWTATYNDETQQLELRQNKTLNVSNWNTTDAIDAINIKYPQIKLELAKHRHDTLFVRITDAYYLTQEAGSAGARVYLAEATFALTELKNIKAVYFNFKEGDHAVPKTYTRADFTNFN